MSTPEYELERALRQLQPRPARLDMADTMFRAGQAAAWWQTVPWIAATVVLLLVVLVQAVLLWSLSNRPAPPIAAPHVPANNTVHEYPTGHSADADTAGDPAR